MAAYGIEISIWLGEIADDVHRAVEIDNGDFLTSSVEGETIVARASSESLKSLLRTVDDFVACIEVAAGAMRRKHAP